MTNPTDDFLLLRRSEQGFKTLAVRRALIDRVQNAGRFLDRFRATSAETKEFNYALRQLIVEKIKERIDDNFYDGYEPQAEGLTSFDSSELPKLSQVSTRGNITVGYKLKMEFDIPSGAAHQRLKDIILGITGTLPHSGYNFTGTDLQKATYTVDLDSQELLIRVGQMLDDLPEGALRDALRAGLNNRSTQSSIIR